MNEMVERVAKALHKALDDDIRDSNRRRRARHDILSWGDLPEGFRQFDRQMARAAIAAMREPTAAMLAEADACRPFRDDGPTSPETYWDAMIDGALK